MLLGCTGTLTRLYIIAVQYLMEVIWNIQSEIQFVYLICASCTKLSFIIWILFDFFLAAINTTPLNGLLFQTRFFVIVWLLFKGRLLWNQGNSRITRLVLWLIDVDEDLIRSVPSLSGPPHVQETKKTIRWPSTETSRAFTAFHFVLLVFFFLYPFTEFYFSAVGDAQQQIEWVKTQKKKVVR